MTATKMIHVRVDEETKDRAAQTLAALGMSVSDGVRLFLKRVVIEQAFPLSLKVPNAETQSAMEEAREMNHARFAIAEDLFDDLAKSAEE